MSLKDYFSAGIILLGIFASNRCSASSIEKTLLNKLLNEYNTQERPVRNYNDTLDMKIGIALTTIYLLDTEDDLLSTQAWLTLKWVDYNLVWDPSNYDGIKSLQIPFHRIWRSDVYLRNSLDTILDNTYQTNVIVSHDGNCTSFVPGVFKSSCSTDVTNYPFDQHNCSLKFGSWTSNAAKINLQLDSKSGGDFSKLMPDARWELIGRVPGTVDRVYYDDDPYMQVTFLMKWKRRGEAIFSACNFVLFLGILGTLLSCLLPITSGFRIPLGIVTLLSIFLMGYSLHTTVNVSYFRRLSILISTSIFLNVLTICIYDINPSVRRMPVWLRKIVFDVIPPFILLNRPTTDTSDFVSVSPGSSGHKEEVSRTESQDQYESDVIPALQAFVRNMGKKETQISIVNDWEFFTIVLDRTIFFFYLVVLLVFWIMFYCEFLFV